MGCRRRERRRACRPSSSCRGLPARWSSPSAASMARSAPGASSISSLWSENEEGAGLVVSHREPGSGPADRSPKVEKPMRKLRSGGAAVAALLVVLTSASISAIAQTPAQAPAANPPQSVFGEQIDVRVANVEVVVPDKQGNRVAGFTPEDFRLKVDGKAVPFEFFNEVR